MNFKPDLPSDQQRLTPFPHNRHISIKKAIEKRSRHPSNIWILDSPKNDKRFHINGTVAFMHAVLLEGDVNVVGYDFDPEPVMSHAANDHYQTTLDAMVRFKDGTTRWWEFKWSQDTGAHRSGRSVLQLEAQSNAASREGVAYEIKTEKHLKHKEILFDNWLMLIAVINRAKFCSSFKETDEINRLFQTHRSLTLASVLSIADTDPAISQAVIGKMLQTGQIATDLDTELFGLNSILRRCEP